MKQMTLDTPALPIPATNPAASPGPRTQPRPGRRWAWTLRLLGPTLLGSGLLWLCYFPMACGWLAWVALVPLFTLLRSQARPWLVYACTFVSAATFFLASISWMPVADDRMYAPWVVLSLYCALYFAVAVYLIRWLERRTPLPLVVTAPVVWAGLEYLRSFLMTGFAWYFLGHTQHNFLHVIQVCDLAGVYAVTLLLVAVNAWIYEALFAWPWLRQCMGQREPASASRLPWLALRGVCVALLVTTALIYGAVRLQEEDFEQGPRVALLQSNLDQRLRNTPLTNDNPESGSIYDSINKHMHSLHMVAVDPRLNADLIVWPETSHTETWRQTPMSIPTQQIPELWMREQVRVQTGLRTYCAQGRKAVLFGINTEVLTEVQERETEFGDKVNVVKKWDRFNAALLVHGDGAVGERYDKIHRVPFGEYVPLRDWIPLMNQFAPYDFDYSIKPGTQLTRFALGRYTFGTLICYEDTDPFLARQYGAKHADGRAVDFLVNLSNDGWFDGSSEHEEHLALSRFRAVETRRAVARSVNMGISAIIDSNGRVLQPLKNWDPPTKDKKILRIWPVQDKAPDMPLTEWAAKKQVPGVVVANIPIDHRTSLYALWGDWLPLSCWALLGVVLLWSLAVPWFAAKQQPASGV